VRVKRNGFNQLFIVGDFGPNIIL